MAAAMRRTGIALLILLLASCSAIYRNHGYVPTDQAMAQLEVGRDSRAEVADAVGRPTATGVLGEDGWYYVQSRFRQFGYRAPVEIDREVVAISFDQGGTLRNIERFGLEDGRVIRLSRRVTESDSQGIGFLRQFFGNIGNFDAGTLLDE